MVPIVRIFVPKLHISKSEIKLTGSVENPRKIGFKDEGILRQHVFKNGEYLDSYVLIWLENFHKLN